MTTRDGFNGDSDPSTYGREHRDEIVGDYVERLNAGERLDPLEVIERYPDFGDAVLEEIYTYVDLGQTNAESVTATPGSRR